MGVYYFLMCLVPPLPPVLGEKTAMPFADVSALVKRHIHGDDRPLLQAQLYAIDAVNWEQRDQGREIYVGGGVMAREDLEEGRDLPEFIRKYVEERERGLRRSYPYDRLWELYYEEALDRAEKNGSRFLRDYLSWDLQLRNQLAAQRAKDRGTPVEEATLLRDLHRSYDFGPLLAQVKAGKHPLQEERLIDEERLRHIYQTEGTSPFTRDALLAYLARGAIYARWEKMAAPFAVEDFFKGGSTWTDQQPVES